MYARKRYKHRIATESKDMNGNHLILCTRNGIQILVNTSFLFEPVGCHTVRRMEPLLISCVSVLQKNTFPEAVQDTMNVALLVS